MALRSGEISLSILSAQIDDRPLYRVVAQADGVDSRELLQRMRSRGFDDAWHIRSSQLSRLSLSAVSSRPAQPSGSVPTQAGMKKGLQEEKNIKTRAASGEHLLATSQRAAQPAPLAEFAGPGAQTVYGSEGGIDLNELQQTLDHDAANVTIDGVRGSRLAGYSLLRQHACLYSRSRHACKVLYQGALLATEKRLYVSSDMEQPADSIVERITRRDDWVDRDTFGVTLDPPARPNWAIGSGSRLATATQTVRCCPSGVGNAIGTDSDWQVCANGDRLERTDVSTLLMLDVPALEGLRNMGFAASRLVSHQNQRLIMAGLWCFQQALCFGVQSHSDEWGSAGSKAVIHSLRCGNL